jgi:hypothetical protein
LCCSIWAELNRLGITHHSNTAAWRAFDNTIIGNNAASQELNPGTILKREHAAPQSYDSPVIGNGSGQS